MPEVSGAALAGTASAVNRFHPKAGVPPGARAGQVLQTQSQAGGVRPQAVRKRAAAQAVQGIPTAVPATQARVIPGAAVPDARLVPTPQKRLPARPGQIRGRIPICRIPTRNRLPPPITPNTSKNSTLTSKKHTTQL